MKRSERISRRLCTAFALVGCLAATSSAGRDIEVITTTEVTAEGMHRAPASRAQPVYYVAVSGGYKDFAAAMNGDQVPAEKDMVTTVMLVLAQNGFLLASKEHPPSQFLTWNWGTMYTNVLTGVSSSPSPNKVNVPGMGQVSTGSSGPQASPPAQDLSYDQKLRFLGGEKLGLVGAPGSVDRSDAIIEPLGSREDDAAHVGRAAQDNLYVIVISSFDCESMKARKPVLLWKTRIGCPSRGLIMDRTLPAMMSIAGPNIGHDTPTPAIARASDPHSGNVRIGDPTLQEFIDGGAKKEEGRK